MKSKKMIQNKEVVPKLRFPEFQGDGEWKKYLLGELSKIVRGGSPRPIDNYLTNAPDGLNWLKIGDVDLNSKYVTSTQEKVRKEALNKTRVVNPGDLILSNSMSFGRPYIMQIKSCIHDGWIAITEVEKKIKIDFLYYLILSSSSQTYFYNNAAGSGVKNLNADIIKLLPSYYPKHEKEQQKIADCLTSIDELIALHKQKLEALKDYKKGLMQQLFPVEGEAVPRLRFAEFKADGEWEEKFLGEIGTFTGGGTPSKSNKKYWKGNIPWISSSDISEDSIYKIKITRYITEEALNNSATKIVPKNSILIVSRVGVGKLAVSNESICTSQDFTNFTPYENHLLFLAYYLKARNRILREFCQGMGIKGFTKEDISNFKLFLPIDSSEQQKIADCLISIDELITAQTQKIESLNEHKKGLMQQLFPSPDEVI